MCLCFRFFFNRFNWTFKRYITFKRNCGTMSCCRTIFYFTKLVATDAHTQRYTLHIRIYKYTNTNIRHVLCGSDVGASYVRRFTCVWRMDPGHAQQRGLQRDKAAAASAWRVGDKGPQRHRTLHAAGGRSRRSKIVGGRLTYIARLN